MPGKEPRVLCPVCQEPIPPDETECANCGAFVIDEAVVRLGRAFGLKRDAALKLVEMGFRHPRQFRDRDPGNVLQEGDVGLLFICTNCGSFVSVDDAKCPRCASEFEETAEEPAPPEADILDLVLCPVCGADNPPEPAECEICGERLGPAEPVPEPEPPRVEAVATPILEQGMERPADTAETPVSSAPAAARTTLTIERPPEAPVSRSPKPSPKPSPTAPLSEPLVLPSPLAKRPEPREPSTTRPLSRPERPLVLESMPHEAPRAMAPRALMQRRVRTPAVAQVRSAPQGDPSGAGVAPEVVAGLVLAGGAGLLLAAALAQTMIVAGIAAFLSGLLAYAAPLILRARIRVAWRDAGLLAAAVALGLGVPILHLASVDSGTAGILFGVGSAIPFAWASRRLLGGPARVVVALASAVPLIGLAVAGAQDLSVSMTLPWTVSVVALLPWPAALAGVEIHRRRAKASLRRQVVRAERNIVKEDYHGSLDEYDRAIESARRDVPGAEVPWYGKGATLILLGRYEEALRAIDTALDINPRSEIAWVNKANALSKLGRHVDALRCLNAAIKVNPRYEVAWNNKGNTLARLSKYDEALECYERAIRIDPDYRGAWVNKGFVLTKLGRLEEAASCADHALDLTAARPEPS